MNWKKISIERLREYEARKEALSLIPEQLEALELSFTAIRAATTDGTPVNGGGGNKREDALINNIAKREELKRSLEIAKRETEITEKGLELLTDEQKKILFLFYIHRTRNHVERLCEELCYEKSKIYELKDEALKIFTMSVCGVVEV